MIALIDNFDSFTYNLVALLEEFGEEVCVIEADSKKVMPLLDSSTHLILSPGPGHPQEATLSLEALKRFYSHKPILGVCLGHQCIAHAFGFEVCKAKEPVHGKTTRLSFLSTPLFEGIMPKSEVMRYHSLCVKELEAPLEAIAWSEDGVVMALRHLHYPLYGVQFHPESILTQEGKRMLENFLALPTPSRSSRKGV